MFSIVNKKGGWVNQYSAPTDAVFVERAKKVDYIIIKYGMSSYERLCQALAMPWLAERMAESGAGSQNGPSNWLQYASELAAQANQPGCVGAVINLEEADGGWHLDNGSGTRALINKFRQLAPGKPLYASLDTRGNRPIASYQQVCAQLCDGVMPMVYPKAFGQSPDQAMVVAVNNTLKQAWGAKPIIPTIQTYNGVGPVSVVQQITAARNIGAKGFNAYTLGHASAQEWAEVAASSMFGPVVPPTPPVTVPTAEQLLRGRVGHLEAMMTLALKGTPDEIVQYAAYWKRATGGV